MEFKKGIEILPLGVRIWGNAMTIHPVLLYDDQEATLVDAGMPDQEEELLGALGRLGLSRERLKRLILTHQDLDHIGAAGALKAATGAKVLAHREDAPYIQGERRLIKFEPERARARLEALAPEARAAMERLLQDLPRVAVDQALEGGEELPHHGGIVVIPTPGHTPGHISLYLKAHRLLIAGDAMRVEGGELLGPNPANTLDVPRAEASLRNLLPYDIDYVLCYHGGLYGPGASRRIEELAAGA